MTGSAATGPLPRHAQTVLGPVVSEALGITLPHEHLLDLRFTYREPEGASAVTALSLLVGYPAAYAMSKIRRPGLLDEERWYDEGDVQTGLLFAALATPTLLPEHAQ